MKFVDALVAIIATVLAVLTYTGLRYRARTRDENEAARHNDQTNPHYRDTQEP